MHIAQVYVAIRSIIVVYLVLFFVRFFCSSLSLSRFAFVRFVRCFFLRVFCCCFSYLRSTISIFFCAQIKRSQRSLTLTHQNTHSQILLLSYLYIDIVYCFPHVLAYSFSISVWCGDRYEYSYI